MTESPSTTPALYAVWFGSGVMIGSAGIATGVLSKSGSLAREWKGWVVVCVVAYAALSVVPSALQHEGMNPAIAHAVKALLWVFSCVASCFAFLAVFRGRQMRPSRLMASLSRSAYVMYLVHYVFITWTQKSLLKLPIHANLKATIVFVTTLGLSWLVAQVLIRLPGVKTVL